MFLLGALSCKPAQEEVVSPPTAESVAVQLETRDGRRWDVKIKVDPVPDNYAWVTTATALFDKVLSSCPPKGSLVFTFQTQDLAVRVVGEASDCVKGVLEGQPFKDLGTIKRDILVKIDAK